MFAAFTNLVRYQPGGRTDPGPGLAIWSVMYQSSAEPGYNERIVERNYHVFKKTEYLQINCHLY